MRMVLPLYAYISLSFYATGSLGTLYTAFIVYNSLHVHERWIQSLTQRRDTLLSEGAMLNLARICTDLSIGLSFRDFAAAASVSLQMVLE